MLSAMERAGAEDMPEDAERQGLGTPATRASILETLVQMGFVERLSLLHISLCIRDRLTTEETASKNTRHFIKSLTLFFIQT